SESWRKRYSVSFERVTSRAAGRTATEFGSIRRMNSASCGLGMVSLPWFGVGLSLAELRANTKSARRAKRNRERKPRGCTFVRAASRVKRRLINRDGQDVQDIDLVFYPAH